MPEEKLPENQEINDETSEQTSVARSANLLPAVALAFVIMVLFGMLIMVAWKKGTFGSAAKDNRLVTLQAEANALRNDYNNQRILMGLRPIENESEPIKDVAIRLKKDADTLVSLADSYQKLIEEKEHELMLKNTELLRSEKLRQATAAESSRLQGELNRALIDGSDSERLRADSANLKLQRDALAAELEAARQTAQSTRADPSVEDFADLKRRLDETLRAKEFFESQVKDLQRNH